MSKWAVTRVSEMADIISGGTPKTEIAEYWNGDIPWLSVKDFSGDSKRVYSSEKSITKLGLNNSATQLLYPGDIIISARGTVGEVAQIGKRMAFNQSCYGLRAKERYSANFLYYVLKYQVKYLKAVANGAVFDTITLKTFDKMKSDIPEFPVQEKIANILSHYDDILEVNNRRIELLEQAAQELYKEWFVRFRFPGYENAKFEDGIPEGWEIKRIVDLFDITSSKRVYLADYVDAGIPFYRSKEIIQLSQGQAITEPLYISNAAYENFKSKYGAPEKNDILITSVGTIGVSYLVDGHEFYFKDGNLTWIKSGSNKALSLFLFQWLNSQSGKQQLLQSTIGTSQSALTIENLKKIKLLVPTKALIEDYYQKAHFMLEQKSALQMNNRNLAVQRDMLLPRLMSGKLEV